MDDDLIPLSALQHFIYCPRQCALIHVEKQWTENRHTAEGKLLHSRTDETGEETRRGIRTATGMPLSSASLGLVGKADVVEFHETDEGTVAVPVEYKRGRPKQHRADEVQLCAQALCLEEMLQAPVVAGALYYGKTKHRVQVVFDEALRALTLDTIAQTRALLEVGRTPPAKYDRRRCESCSLIELCLPKKAASSVPVQAWLLEQISE